MYLAKRALLFLFVYVTHRESGVFYFILQCIRMYIIPINTKSVYRIYSHVIVTEKKQQKIMIKISYHQVERMHSTGTQTHTA